MYFIKMIQACLAKNYSRHQNFNVFQVYLYVISFDLIF